MCWNKYERFYKSYFRENIRHKLQFNERYRLEKLFRASPLRFINAIRQHEHLSFHHNILTNFCCSMTRDRTICLFSKEFNRFISTLAINEGFLNSFPYVILYDGKLPEEDPIGNLIPENYNIAFYILIEEPINYDRFEYLFFLYRFRFDLEHKTYERENGRCDVSCYTYFMDHGSGEFIINNQVTIRLAC